jgi:hypothetical protein
MTTPATTPASLPVRTCRRQLRNLVGAAVALHAARRPRDVASILARQACQALGARQAVASVAGAGDSAGVPFRAVAGDAHTLSGDHLRLLEQVETDGINGVESLVDPSGRGVQAVAMSINDREGRPVGALMVADGHSGAFAEDDLAVLVGLAHMAALTLDGRRLSGRPSAGDVRRAAAETAGKLVDLLTVILGHASLLDATLPELDTRREDIDTIRAAAEQAGRLSSRLLALSRDPKDEP